MKETKREEYYTRANNIIQSDKSLLSDSCKTLVLQDFMDVFEEYFELSSIPEMEITFEKGIYKVNVHFEADRIKKFNVLK